MTDLRKAAEMALEALETLWDILDDIDTASDMAKENDAWYRKRVEALQKKRWDTMITTDGYKLKGGPVEALRQALAQPVDAVNISQERVDKTAKDRHEPVAWIHDGGKGELWWYRSSKFDEEGNLIGDNPDDVPLYTAPPKREWVGLTDEEIHEVVSKKWWDWEDAFDIEGFSRAIEAKLKEKNGG